ncbi:MAG: 50S ribosomal protein L15 [Gemmatimonadetes bacterium]|nr:50S ribosomal protein L15 [Gemmatimonadota bacterium]
MAELHDLRAPTGSRRARKRVGRGPGSGHGKTAGRGHKGHKQRSGGQTNPHFEGGQMPLHRRVPKRGFHPLKRIEYQIVNVRDLDRLEAAEISPEVLKANGLIRALHSPVKILGDGSLEKALVVRAHAFSKSAREKIEAAGGQTVAVAFGAAS